MIRRLLLALLLLAPVLPAQQRTPADSLRDDRDFSFYAKGPYRAAIPRPESILGYDVGTWHTQYANQEKVLLGIAAAATDRVRVEQIGVSNEKRTMRIYLVSAP